MMRASYTVGGSDMSEERMQGIMKGLRGGELACKPTSRACRRISMMIMDRLMIRALPSADTFQELHLHVRRSNIPKIARGWIMHEMTRRPDRNQRFHLKTLDPEAI